MIEFKAGPYSLPGDFVVLRWVCYEDCEVVLTTKSYIGALRFIKESRYPEQDYQIWGCTVEVKTGKQSWKLVK